jgi:hypothetical protein
VQSVISQMERIWKVQRCTSNQQSVGAATGTGLSKGQHKDYSLTQNKRSKLIAKLACFPNVTRPSRTEIETLPFLSARLYAISYSFNVLFRRLVHLSGLTQASFAFASRLLRRTDDRRPTARPGQRHALGTPTSRRPQSALPLHCHENIAGDTHPASHRDD